MIRHAHRDTAVRSADNGLSVKGSKQAAALGRHFERMFGEEHSKSTLKILASPKLRCVETVMPIARLAGVPIQASNRLLERGPRESAGAFERRTREFLTWWKADGPKLTIVCSHGDWLPVAAKALTGAHIEFRKGSWTEVVLEREGVPEIRWVIQRLSRT